MADDADIFKGPPVAALLACQLVSGVPQGQGHARQGGGGEGAATQGSPTLLSPPWTPSPPATSAGGAQRSTRMLHDSVASASARPGITGRSAELSRSHGGSLASSPAAVPSPYHYSLICCSLVLHLTCQGIKEENKNKTGESQIRHTIHEGSQCRI